MTPNVIDNSISIISKRVLDGDTNPKNNTNKLSYKKLDHHIKKTLPLNPLTNKAYGFCSKISTDWFITSLFNPFCCGFMQKKGKFKKLSNNDAGPQIGHASTLYLQMMKGISLMFLVLAIINISVFFIIDVEKTMFSGLHFALSYYTLGNVGEAGLGCSYSKIDVLGTYDSNCTEKGTVNSTSQLKNNEKLLLSCEANSIISEINEFGMFENTGFNGQNLNPHEICDNVKNFPFTSYTWNVFSSSSA